MSCEIQYLLQARDDTFFDNMSCDKCLLSIIQPGGMRAPVLTVLILHIISLSIARGIWQMQQTEGGVLWLCVKQAQAPSLSRNTEDRITSKEYSRLHCQTKTALRNGTLTEGRQGVDTVIFNTRDALCKHKSTLSQE